MNDISIYANHNIHNLQIIRKLISIKGVLIVHNIFDFEKNNSGYTLISYNGNEKKVRIPDTYDGEDVTIIADKTFKSNYKIREVILPKNLLEIGNNCFDNCMFLENIDIPNSVILIGHHAFENCVCFNEIVIPSSVKTICNNAFGICENLKKITLNEGLQVLDGTVFERCSNLQEVVLPKSLSSIGNYCFSNCTSLKRVTLLNDKTVVSHEPLDRCPNLEQVSFKLLTTLPIEQQADLLVSEFNKNDGFSKEELTHIRRKRTLKKYLFKGDFPEIISFLIYKKTKLSLDELDSYLQVSIELDRPIITAILLEYKNHNYSNEDISTAKDRKELVELGFELPTFKEFSQKWTCIKRNGIIRISGYKGEDTAATIPVSLSDNTKIGRIVNLNYCDYAPLEILTIEAQITQIEKYAFYCCATLREVILSDTITTIENSAFSNCYALEKVTLPKNLKILGKSVFEDCENLEEITIPASVRAIGNSAFEGCISLTKVNFLGEMPKLGKNAFAGSPVEMSIK